MDFEYINVHTVYKMSVISENEMQT